MGSLGEEVSALAGPDLPAVETALVAGGAVVGAERWEGAGAAAAGGFVD